MVPFHLCSAPIAEEHFLEETRLTKSLEKVNSKHLRVEFQKGQRHFFEGVREQHHVDCCSTFSGWARPQLFHTRDHVGGDDYSVLYISGQLIHGLLNLVRVRGSKVEAAKAEIHSFVREQHQVEQSGICLVSITDVFSFCFGRPGLRSCWHLYRVSIWPKISYFSFGNFEKLTHSISCHLNVSTLLRR